MQVTATGRIYITSKIGGIKDMPLTSKNLMTTGNETSK
jgi:hypothetical protein